MRYGNLFSLRPKKLKINKKPLTMVKENPINLIKPPRILLSLRIMMIIRRPINNTMLLIRMYFFISSPSTPSYFLAFFVH